MLRTFVLPSLSSCQTNAVVKIFEDTIEKAPAMPAPSAEKIEVAKDFGCGRIERQQGQSKTHIQHTTIAIAGVAYPMKPGCSR
mmetsp:Transcript_35396/g.92919  ORF Transcript_35396/g.92919 Transcript_35396/m.92919 type:complete len:83 (-) Transcript_35396:593-841(-)